MPYESVRVECSRFQTTHSHWWSLGEGERGRVEAELLCRGNRELPASRARRSMSSTTRPDSWAWAVVRDQNEDSPEACVVHRLCIVYGYMQGDRERCMRSRTYQMSESESTVFGTPALQPQGLCTHPAASAWGCPAESLSSPRGMDPGNKRVKEVSQMPVTPKPDAVRHRVYHTSGPRFIIVDSSSAPTAPAADFHPHPHRDPCDPEHCSSPRTGRALWSCRTRSTPESDSRPPD